MSHAGSRRLWMGLRFPASLLVIVLGALSPRGGDGAPVSRAQALAATTAQGGGACCREDGLCTMVTSRFDCERAFLGTYLGDSTVCEAGTCFAACCHGDGTCAVSDARSCMTTYGYDRWRAGADCASVTCTSGACCAPSGCAQVAAANYCYGTFQGDGTRCGDVTCPPTGACCISYSVDVQDCYALTPEDCASYSGVYEGDGSSCETAPCTGACCGFDGSCTRLGSASCFAYKGDGTDCSTVTCPSPGACCIGGFCGVTTRDACVSGGGTYEGDGTGCDTAPCSIPGACLYSTFYCYPVEPVTCSDSGGTYLGDGTSCANGGVGACCRFDGTCDRLDEHLCRASGGVYAGEGSACCASTCAACASSTCSVSLEAARDNTLFEDPGGLLSDGAGLNVFVGRIPQGSGLRRRALLAFDVAGSVPPRSVIVSAKLTLNLRTDPRIGGTKDSSIGAHRALADWGEGSSYGQGQGEGRGVRAESGDATWLHRFYDGTLWGSPGGDFAPEESAAQTVPGYLPPPPQLSYSWASPGLTADVQAWLDDPASNHGWILIGREDASGTVKAFWSREQYDRTLRPRLDILFRAAGGACCEAGGECSESLDSPACVAQGGTFRYATDCSSACPPRNGDCGDGDSCTVDSCDPHLDCVHAPGNAGTLCRAAAGPCDADDFCDGTTPGCPNSYAAPTRVCRPAEGECDRAESCTGVGAECPPDGFAPPGAPCGDDGNPCTSDACDGSGTCVLTFVDADGDSVPDCQDVCPHSLLGPTVVVGATPEGSGESCDSGAPNPLLGLCVPIEPLKIGSKGPKITCIGGKGCTVSDDVESCRSLAGDLDKWKECVERLTKALKDERAMNEKQRHAIQKCVQAVAEALKNHPDQHPVAR